MILKSFVVAGCIATATAATLGQKQELFECGAPPPTDEHRNISKRLAEREAHFNDKRQVNGAAITVDAYAHVVYSSQDAAGGFLSEDVVKQQFQKTNEHYASTGFTFNLKGVDFEQNQQWASAQDEMGMKAKLRKGGYGDLNVYYLATLGGGASGVCYLPTTSSPGSQINVIDGCSVVASTVPGGTGGARNMGQNDMVLTHEIGHFLGLYHTFEGGCQGQGDMVSDTTPQQGPTQGCPQQNPPHSCGLAQADPINNFMDYASPPCAREFTAGQINRMKSSWQEFRQGKQGGGNTGGGGSPQPPTNPTNPGNGGGSQPPTNPTNPGNGGGGSRPPTNPTNPGNGGGGSRPPTNPTNPGNGGGGSQPPSNPGNGGNPGFPGDGGNPGFPGNDGSPGFPGGDGNPGFPGGDGNPGFPGFPPSQGNPGFPDSGFPPFPDNQNNPGFPGDDGSGFPGDGGFPGFSEVPPFPVNVESGTDSSDGWYTWFSNWVRRSFTPEKRADVSDEIAALRQTEIGW